LESVDRLGSITRAAKDVGLSYKTAWDAVDAMSNLAACCSSLWALAPGINLHDTT
jgi:molybdate transport repressor ModE-like protein